MYLDDLYFRIVYSKNGKSILTSEYLQSINDLKYFELYKFWQDTKVLKLKLEDTIHYKLLLDRVFWKNNYIEYIKNSNQQDHSLDKFMSLYENFDQEQLKENKITIFKKFGSYYVLDGNHRLAIMRNKLNVKFLKSEYYSII